MEEKERYTFREREWDLYSRMHPETHN